jgi:hypothetical protein
MKKKITDSELIELLKNLPREKAPENFEFNLMTKIKNNNFGNVADEKGSLLWVFLPSATIVTAAVVVLMFLFSSVENSSVNVLVPKKVQKAKTKTYLIVENNKASKDEIEAVKIVKAPNDVVTKQKVKIPVNPSSGLPVDNFLNKSISGKNSAATLVSSEEKLPFEFEGFLPYASQKKITNRQAKKDSTENKNK